MQEVDGLHGHMTFGCLLCKAGRDPQGFLSSSSETDGNMMTKESGKVSPTARDAIQEDPPPFRPAFPISKRMLKGSVVNVLESNFAGDAEEMTSPQRVISVQSHSRVREDRTC
jgi:hypothetical protein